MAKKQVHTVNEMRPYILIALGIFLGSMFIYLVNNAKSGNTFGFAISPYIQSAIAMSGFSAALYFFMGYIKNKKFQSWRLFLAVFLTVAIYNVYSSTEFFQSPDQFGQIINREIGGVLLYDLLFQTPLLFAGSTLGIEWLFNKMRWLENGKR